MTRAESIDTLIAKTIRKSRTSLVITVVFVSVIALAIVLLSRKAAELANQVEQKTADLARSELELQKTRDSIDLYKKSMGDLQTAIRALLNRNYPDAIAGFERFLEVFPGDAQGLNYLGYAQFRYAHQLRDQASKGGDDTDPARAGEMFAKAETNLRKAVDSDPANVWPNYNLALLLYHTDRGTEALESLDDLLGSHPEVIKSVCDDGQFRKMRLDRSISQEFIRIVTSAAAKNEIHGCWVVSAPVR